ncbi:acetate--CoA ligase family protein [Cytobacillus kochii]|uniref:acetate--CoA ligase family protein n=1 Tax=Cytobacillus kochii TaxID=859143 RepID=UPI002E1E76BE|nr:acetate--CoA ligase family protein [Cytobacillus kochii]
MFTMDDLSPMLAPNAIAIIGASGDQTKISYKPIANLKEVGYQGDVYLVNPKYDEILGYPCYQEIEELPEHIDLALISVGAKSVLSIIKQLHAKKVKSILIFSSGFTEIGKEGAMLEKEIQVFSERHHLPICGPNSLGLFNFNKQMIASFSSLKACDSAPIAFVTQSGAMGSLTHTLATELGIGFQAFVSSGNESTVDFFNYIDYFAKSPDIKVIGGYLEGARDEAKMSKAITACHQNNKPLVLIKVGTSVIGADAASSHTASLAGNAKVYESYFTSKNVVLVDDEEELIDTLSLFNYAKNISKDGGAVIVTQSGGAGIMMADQCERKGIKLATLEAETKESLAQTLPTFASIKNPVDMTAQVNQNPNQIIDTLNVLVEAREVQSIVLYIQMTDHLFTPIIGKLSALIKKANKPIVVCWAGIKENTKKQLFNEKSIPWIPTPTRTINALSNVVNYYTTTKQQVSVHEKKGYAKQSQSPMIVEEKLNEWEGKQLLQSIGIQVPKGSFVRNQKELHNHRLQYPLVLKGVSKEITHKSDYQLVQTHIKNQQDLLEHFERMRERIKHAQVDHLIEGMMIEEMAEEGIEVIIGAIDDPTFGPTIMFGVGGIFTEILEDVVFLPAPITEAQALQMITSIKAFPLLNGARGNQKSDIKALAITIQRLSEFCTSHREEWTEMEFNPILVHKEGKGVTAVDAVIVGKKQAEICN